MDALASGADAGGCCDGHSHSHAHHEHDDVDVINDPTLMSCCDKDRVAYDRAMALKSLLTEHDPTTQNVRMRQQVVAEPPQRPSVTTTKTAQAQAATAAAAIAERLRAMEVTSDDDDDSDLELDEDFDALFAARRQELAAQFQVAAKNAADGYGIILETDLQALLKELSAQPEVPRVAFVRSSGLDAGVAHDMLTQMLSLASRFLGTKFYSVTTSGSTDDEAMRQLRLTTAPTIVAFRRGQRVDATAIQDKELAATSATILWEARLVPWLTMCNVLEATRPFQDGPSGRLSRSTSLKRGDADAEPAYDCGVSGCRIRFAYEHEHVGPSQEAKAEISAWRTPGVSA